METAKQFVVGETSSSIERSMLNTLANRGEALVVATALCSCSSAASSLGAELWLLVRAATALITCVRDVCQQVQARM
jgi:hypothetical protein